ncbi:MAG: dihydroorotate dehydrogenase [Candidatus Eisenbacteria bacterium]|jgi:dihydroorotate dehydrogenase (NAD+) catalytic subunit|nr:dihydroorotate dehydrogenase [Candidatus Eisenbacteria bacterium]
MNPIQTTLPGLTLASPLVLASGILGLTASSLARVASLGAGAVTTKSFGVEPRAGHKAPSILPYEHGILNCVGLSNPGVDQMIREIWAYRARSVVPIIASVFGKTVEEFGVVTARALEAEPDMIEANVSCPNVAAEFGVPFGADFGSCAQVTGIVKKNAGRIPVAVKLTVNCPAIGRMAGVCEEHGADVITAINTIGPGMLIATDVRRPVLSNLTGGVSGPAVFPVALRAVWEVRKHTTLPIIGVGGVTTVDHAVQMLMAGATAVGIGSAVHYGGVDVFQTINEGLREFARANGLASLGAVIGTAHSEPPPRGSGA